MYFNPDINTTFLIKFMVLYSLELMTVSYIYKGAANIYKKREITYINSLFQVQREIYDNMYKRYNTLRDVKHDMGNYVRTMELIGANDIASSGKSVDREQLEETYKVDLEDKIGYVDTNTYTKYSMVNEYLEEIAMYCNREKLTVDIQADIEELSEDKEMILCIVLKSIFTEMIEGRVYNIEDKDRDIRLEIRCKGSIDIKATTSLNYTKNKDDKIKKKVKESKKILNYTRDIYDGKIIRDKNGIELNIL